MLRDGCVIAKPHTFFIRRALQDRKSTRLNSSHSQISYAVFCLKKKKILPFPWVLQFSVSADCLPCRPRLLGPSFIRTGLLVWLLITGLPVPLVCVLHSGSWHSK